MKLFELQGIKAEKDNYKSVIDATTPHFENVEKARLISFMKNKGFNILGEGAYGIVVQHSSSNYVIKFYKNDPCYDAFVKLCLENKDKSFLPRFLRSPATLGNGYKMVRMEPLVSIVSDTQNTSLIDKIKIMYRKIFLQGHRPISCGDDLHEYNVMKRANGALVITDPWADWDTRESKNYELRSKAK